jgi:hypothetical protein
MDTDTDRREGRPSLDGPGARPWFVYTRTPGRLFGTPASLMGWVSLLAFIGGITLLLTYVMPLFTGLHPILIVLIMLAIMSVAFLFFLKLVVAKGRELR